MIVGIEGGLGSGLMFYAIARHICIKRGVWEIVK